MTRTSEYVELSVVIKNGRDWLVRAGEEEDVRDSYLVLDPTPRVRIVTKDGKRKNAVIDCGLATGTPVLVLAGEEEGMPVAGVLFHPDDIPPRKSDRAWMTLERCRIPSGRKAKEGTEDVYLGDNTFLFSRPGGKHHVVKSKKRRHGEDYVTLYEPVGRGKFVRSEAVAALQKLDAETVLDS